MTATCTTVAGVFRSRDDALRAVAQLQADSYRDDQIGVVAKYESIRPGADIENTVGEGAAAGAGIGALAGAGTLAMASLAVSFGVIPVIGPILAVGPLAAALVSATGGAIGGAATGGLVGALAGWGISEEEAREYESDVKAGRYLVTVECGQGDDARDILSNSGGRVRSAN